jgi:hypothetical protein
MSRIIIYGSLGRFRACAARTNKGGDRVIEPWDELPVYVSPMILVGSISLGFCLGLLLGLCLGSKAERLRRPNGQFNDLATLQQQQLAQSLSALGKAVGPGAKVAASILQQSRQPGRNE